MLFDWRSFLYLLAIVLSVFSAYMIIKWRHNKPIIPNFRSSDILNAFVLNSLSAALVILVALRTRDAFELKTSTQSYITMFATTFITSLLTLTVMYITMGYGQGMVIKTGKNTYVEEEARKKDEEKTKKVKVN